MPQQMLRHFLMRKETLVHVPAVRQVPNISRETARTDVLCLYSTHSTGKSIALVAEKILTVDSDGIPLQL